MSKEISHEIGIVMGGYLDENKTMMGRDELNKRIARKDEVIRELQRENNFLKSFFENFKSCNNCIDMLSNTNRCDTCTDHSNWKIK